MKKTNKFLIFSISIPIVITLLIGLFIIDIGINSKFFIKKDFNAAFEYLLTGDCTSFNNYLYKNGDEDWCKKVHNIDGAKTKNFAIQNLSHKFGSNKAFLNIELTIVSDGKEQTIMMNREMKRVNFAWKIIQSKK